MQSKNKLEDLDKRKFLKKQDFNEANEYLDMESRTLFNIKLLQLITKSFGKTLSVRKEIAIKIGKKIAKAINENINSDIEDEYSSMIGKGKLYPLEDYIVNPDRLINSFSTDVRVTARESFISELGVQGWPETLPDVEEDLKVDIPF